MADRFGVPIPSAVDWEAMRREIARNMRVSYAALTHRKAIVAGLASRTPQCAENAVCCQ